MSKLNTVIFVPIRDDLIERALETLYKYTDHASFRVIIIDQSLHGICRDVIDRYAHIYVRPYRNLGFAHACNTGVRLVDTPYFTLANDDVEWINKAWWQGVLDTFDKVDEATPEKPCAMVCPASIRLPDWSIGREKGDHMDILPYKEGYTQQDWEFLVNEPHYVNEHLTIQPGTVIDGVVMYHAVFKTNLFHEVGYLDEKFMYGGGEDYDWGCRANILGYRSVGTTLSWVFHHWSKSLANQSEYALLIDDARRWNNNSEKWGKDFDIWGNGLSPAEIPPTFKAEL